jgi:hypothetical protein
LELGIVCVEGSSVVWPGRIDTPEVGSAGEEEGGWAGVDLAATKMKIDRAIARLDSSRVERFPAIDRLLSASRD